MMSGHSGFQNVSRTVMICHNDFMSSQKWTVASLIYYTESNKGWLLWKVTGFNPNANVHTGMLVWEIKALPVSLKGWC